MARVGSHVSTARLLPALLPLAAGCAASISTHVSEPIRPQQPAEVALLAVMPGTVEVGSEWVRPETMQRLVLALRERFTRTEIIGPEETARRLAAQSLAEEYASLLADFEGAGVVDPGRVEQVLNAVRATHFLHIQAGYVGEGLQRATTNLDGIPLFYSTKYQRLYAVVRLWESSGSAPSWEAVAQAHSQAGPFSRDRDPGELVESLVLSIAERLPLAGSSTAEASRDR